MTKPTVEILQKKIDRVTLVLLQMKRELEGGRGITLRKVNQALSVVIEDSSGAYNLEDYGFQDKHKQGFII